MPLNQWLIRSGVFILLVAVMTGCQYQAVSQNQLLFLSVDYSSSITPGFKQKANSLLEVDKQNGEVELNIMDVTFQKRALSGGTFSQSMQLEIKGTLQYSTSKNKIIATKTIQSIAQIPINRENPISEIGAQRAAQKELEIILLQNLLREIWFLEN